MTNGVLTPWTGNQIYGWGREFATYLKFKIQKNAREKAKIGVRIDDRNLRGKVK